MPKNLFQDMVKNKNSIRRERPRDIPKREVPEYLERPRVDIPREFSGNTKNNSKYGLWFVAAICIVFFLFALSFFFARAQVSIDPKIRDISLDENLSATKDSNNDGLAFDLVIISGDETKSVVGGEEKQVSLKSKGTAVIYNKFSSTPQKLAINTTLEGSNGATYKTTAAVVVPGMYTEGMPGKISVEINGASPGKEFDSEAPLDLKILGFKGTSKYEKIYGFSEAPIIGGFEGMSPMVSDADKEVAFGELKQTLEKKLLQKATDQIPPGFILFKDATFLNIDEESSDFVTVDGGVPLNVKGTLYGFLLSEKKLTQKIAKDNVTDFDDTNDVYIPNIRDLTFTLTDNGISFRDVQNINFKISGTAKVVWRFDDIAFAKALLGKSKSDFNQLLSAYPNIDSAQLVLSPFWVRSIPGKLKDIKVIVNYPK